MSKIRRKVTVENTKTISDSTSRRPSVFERLGPSTGSTAETQCRNWLKTGNCLYGNTCRFVHGPSPRGKGYSSSYRRIYAIVASLLACVVLFILDYYTAFKNQTKQQ